MTQKINVLKKPTVPLTDNQLYALRAIRKLLQVDSRIEHASTTSTEDGRIGIYCELSDGDYETSDFIRVIVGEIIR